MSRRMKDEPGAPGPALSREGVRMDVRRFAQIFGAVYVLVGLVGFVVTGFDHFAGSQGDTLILFDLNPLHNLVHLAVGGLWLYGSRREDTARSVTLLIGAVYAVVGVLGLFVTGDSSANILALNQADNLLHLVTAVLALYVALAGRPPAVPAPRGASGPGAPAGGAV